MLNNVTALVLALTGLLAAALPIVLAFRRAASLATGDDVNSETSKAPL